ncbi:MAG: hypothetical protein ABI537_17210 [Casimicrobiaceae bacterium]
MHRTIGIANARANDTESVVAALRKQLVEVHGLMRAMEVAATDMQDARADAGGIVSRYGDAWRKCGQSCLL